MVLDSYFPMQKCDSVLTNNHEDSYAAVRHIIDHDHDKIGYLHSSIWINNFDKRTEGFIKAMTDFSLKPSKKYILNLESTIDRYYPDMTNLLSQI